MNVFQIAEVARVLLPQNDRRACIGLVEVDSFVEFDGAGDVPGLFHFGQYEHEERASNLDLVAGSEFTFGDGHAIDESTITAIQIFDLELPGSPRDQAV